MSCFQCKVISCSAYWHCYIYSYDAKCGTFVFIVKICLASCGCTWEEGEKEHHYVYARSAFLSHFTMKTLLNNKSRLRPPPHKQPLQIRISKSENRYSMRVVLLGTAIEAKHGLNEVNKTRWSLWELLAFSRDIHTAEWSFQQSSGFHFRHCCNTDIVVFTHRGGNENSASVILIPKKTPVFFPCILWAEMIKLVLRQLYLNFI